MFKKNSKNKILAATIASLFLTSGVAANSDSVVAANSAKVSDTLIIPDINDKQPILITKKLPLDTEQKSQLLLNQAVIALETDSHKSKQLFEQAIKLNPNNLDAILALASLIHNDQGSAKSLEFLENSLEKCTQSKNKKILASYYAKLALEHNLAAKSKDILEQQKQLSPTENYLLALSYFESGEFLKAAKILETNLSKVDHPDYHLQLGLCYLHLHQIVNATPHLKKARSSYTPNSKSYKLAEQAINLAKNLK